MQPVNGYKALKILFDALFVGQAVFIAAAFFVIKQKVIIPSQNIENIFLPVSIVVALSCIILGAGIFKTRLQKLNDVQLPLQEKFVQYRTNSIIRWALLEGPCLLAVTGYLVTANQLFLLIAGILLLVFTSTAPAKSKVCAHLGINNEDLESIGND